MFLGEYNCSIDSKNRMAIPSVIRKTIESDGDDPTLYISKGFEQCLSLYPKKQFDEMVIDKLKTLPGTSQKVRSYKRMLFSGYNALDGWDKQGRIVIPQNQKEYAGLGKEVIVIGSMDLFEIWDAENWRKFKEDNENSFVELSEEITLMQ